MVAICVGGVPRGEDFFDREEFMKNLWETLKNNNVLLLAPRRYGKTAVMHKLEDTQSGYPFKSF